MSLQIRLVILAAVLLGLTAGGWKIHHSGKVAGRSEVLAEWDAEKVALVEFSRRTEANKREANQKVDNDYQALKARAAADKRITDDRLRDFQAAASAGADTASAGGIDDPYPRIASECAAALVVLDGHAKQVASKASALQSYAGQVCVSQPEK